MSEEIRNQLAMLERMSTAELKVEWRKYFECDPVRFQRDHMMRRIAYQIQVRAYGGLARSVERQLRKIAAQGWETTCRKFSLAPGTELVRTYQGKRIVVRVMEDGFEYGVRCYTSLSAIASEIMDCRVSGPKFFGLRERSHD